MQPLLILTRLPMLTFSPIIAPFTLQESDILVCEKTTESLIRVFFPTETFLPKTAYGPTLAFSSNTTFLSIATGSCISTLLGNLECFGCV
jgi:hypothetical protein